MNAASFYTCHKCSGCFHDWLIYRRHERCCHGPPVHGSTGAGSSAGYPLNATAAAQPAPSAAVSLDRGPASRWITDHCDPPPRESFGPIVDADRDAFNLFVREGLSLNCIDNILSLIHRIQSAPDESYRVWHAQQA